MYFIEKNLTRLNNNQATFFLDPKEFREVTSKLKKNEYSIYYPYKDSEKIIIYNKHLPEVLLYEIKCNSILRHQDILGALFSLNIDKSLFGDILIIDGRYYIYILKILENYFESNFIKIKNSSISLKQIDLNTLKDYERKYEKIEIIVSSLRIDTIISTLCHIKRSSIINKIKKKEIILNYDYLKNTSYIVKENDVFSVKKIGKFKYNGIIKNTKSNHLIIEIIKYI